MLSFLSPVFPANLPHLLKEACGNLFLSLRDQLQILNVLLEVVLCLISQLFLVGQDSKFSHFRCGSDVQALFRTYTKLYCTLAILCQLIFFVVLESKGVDFIVQLSLWTIVCFDKLKYNASRRLSS